MKKKNLLTLITLMLIPILLIQSASALVIYLRPIKMRLYTNVVPGKIGTAEGTYVIENRNNVTIKVDFEPINDIVDVTKIENNITLEPYETKNVDFVVELTEPGTYNGGFRVTYSSDSTSGVSLDTDVTVIAAELPPEPNFLLDNLIYILLGVCVVIIIIAIAYMRRKK